MNWISLTSELKREIDEYQRDLGQAGAKIAALQEQIKALESIVRVYVPHEHLGYVLESVPVEIKFFPYDIVRVSVPRLL